ncbi:hypothetical protein PMI07_000845 [Rhizobium sp. CF080]|uniref:hypothetical protein n=1 Tax=Rhizobium sp. (strain CF080) TaxID=1144310 RepID=UPI000271BCBB|nr:hypothetical protein [Rhizobium sp. CF080]EUB97269.1 hypothetical protein PMI07_000845 [Rhizobium sp. CF080]
MPIKRIGYAHAADIDSLAGDTTSWSVFIKKQPRKDANGIEVFASVKDDPKARFSDADAYTHLQMEAALCAWEWLCENRDHDLLKDYFEGLGSSAMRHCSVQAGDIALRVHTHTESQGYEFVNAYDWEFVPEVLRRLDWKLLTEDNQYNREPYHPDIHTIFVSMVAADKGSTTDPSNRDFQRKKMTPEEYITACRAEAERQWGYGDLVSDHPERITAAMEAGQTPTEITYEIGKKYDLIPRTGYLG